VREEVLQEEAGRAGWKVVRVAGEEPTAMVAAMAMAEA
jgi:hypothetical protein